MNTRHETVAEMRARHAAAEAQRLADEKRLQEIAEGNIGDVPSALQCVAAALLEFRSDVRSRHDYEDACATD